MCLKIFLKTIKLVQNVLKGLQSSWFSFLMPLSTEVWISLVVATIVVILALTFIKMMSDGHMEVLSSVFLIIPSLFGQGNGEIPRHKYSYVLYFGNHLTF